MLKKSLIALLILVFSTLSFFIRPYVYPPKKPYDPYFDTYCGTLQGRGVAVITFNGEEYAEPIECGVVRVH